MAMKYVLVLCLSRVLALDNGLVKTPPMGWLAWERFRCEVDCKNYPNECIGEKLFMDMADRLYEDGWIKYGYNMVNIDDCWPERERDSDNKLVPNKERFPNGIAKLADYVHEKGLKLGIYGDMGTRTCGGYPGSMGYEKIDAQTFAAWGIDMLKLDGCYSNSTQQAIGYPLMGKELNATGRPIIYSCSWPDYQGGVPPKVNYTRVAEVCNLWRNYNDIDDSFESVKNIIGWFATNQDALIPAAGPGHWNDPDMLIGGDFSLSFDQARTQFGIWAILAAPLLVSADLRNIDDKFKTIYFNREVIRVNQDPLGIQGRRVKGDNNYQLWARPLINNEQAIAVMSTRIDGTPGSYTFSMKELGIKDPEKMYQLLDIFDDAEPQLYAYEDLIHTRVNIGGIKMFRAIPFNPSSMKYNFDGFKVNIL